MRVYLYSALVGAAAANGASDAVLAIVNSLSRGSPAPAAAVAPPTNEKVVEIQKALTEGAMAFAQASAFAQSAGLSEGAAAASGLGGAPVSGSSTGAASFLSRGLDSTQMMAIASNVMGSVKVKSARSCGTGIPSGACPKSWSAGANGVCTPTAGGSYTGYCAGIPMGLSAVEAEEMEIFCGVCYM
ncbi:unnamed protein product [Amoebophrya sp. A25]|nr:unnamed protein product [Amoebophrya sp. A25]|eukprot:GSA25T00026559001.1